MKIAVFIVSLALFLGGIYLFGAASSFDHGQAAVFLGGILCVTCAFALPMLIMPRLRP